MDKKKMWIFTEAVAVGAAAGSGVYAAKNRHRLRGEGKTALITGASGGIGLEFAKKFAQNHYDVVITARSVEKLEALASELEETYGVNVTVIPADLSTPDGAQQLYNEVKKRDILSCTRERGYTEDA